MTATKVLDYLARIAGILALIFGLGLWGGRLDGLVSLHMALGVAVVLALWGLVALALRRGVSPWLAVGAAIWGLAALALGPTQIRILPGELHWLVQVAHLALGFGAIALAAVLARSLRFSRVR